MSDRKILGIEPYFQTEVSIALFKLSGAAIALSGTVATVTLASHLLSAGDFVTFSGVTSTTGLNDATWGPVTITSSGVYTFPCTLTGTPGGTIVQEKLYFPPAGQWVCTLGANGQLEYNPGSTLLINGTGAGLDPTWRVLIAASVNGSFVSDGMPTSVQGGQYTLGSFRFRENGTTATSRFNRVS